MPPRALRASGFTLVEVLVGLGVAVLMVGALAAALIGSLNAERAADRMFEGGLLLQEQAALRTVALPDQDQPEPLAGWLIHTQGLDVGKGTNAVAWTVLELSPQDHPSLLIPASFRAK